MAGSDGAIDYRILERVDLGGRIPILGKPDMAIVGEAVHSILAADRPDALRADREAKAQRILQRWSVPAIDPRDAIVCADRLWRFLRERFPEARIRREVPVHAVLGTQIVNGRLDLIVEGEDWFVIVDHKSFPGAPDRWDAKALGYAPQLALYGRAAEIATGKASRGYLVHMPLVGVVCEVGALELVG
jgi:ATP-dependent exoDNAse (exonuclease V) beta subunit